MARRLSHRRRDLGSIGSSPRITTRPCAPDRTTFGAFAFLDAGSFADGLAAAGAELPEEDMGTLLKVNDVLERESDSEREPSDVPLTRDVSIWGRARIFHSA